MPLFRNFRERVRLLEYENEMLSKRVKALEQHTTCPSSIHVMSPCIIREDGWDLSYNTLKKRHRK